MLRLSCRRRIGFPAKIAPGQLMLDRKFTVFISNTNEGGEVHLCNMNILSTCPLLLYTLLKEANL